jgi:hypothetical protein
LKDPKWGRSIFIDKTDPERFVLWHKEVTKQELSNDELSFGAISYEEIIQMLNYENIPLATSEDLDDWLLNEKKIQKIRS